MNYRNLIPAFLRSPLPKPVVVYIPSRKASVLRDWEKRKAETTAELKKALGRVSNES